MTSRMSRNQLGDLWFQPYHLDEMLFLAPAQVEYERYVDREVPYLRLLGKNIHGLAEGRYVFRFDYDDQVEDDWFAGWVSISESFESYDVESLEHNESVTEYRVEFLTEPAYVGDFSNFLHENNDVLRLVDPRILEMEN